MTIRDLVLPIDLNLVSTRKLAAVHDLTTSPWAEGGGIYSGNGELLGNLRISAGGLYVLSPGEAVMSMRSKDP